MIAKLHFLRLRNCHVAGGARFSVQAAGFSRRKWHNRNAGSELPAGTINRALHRLRNCHVVSAKLALALAILTTSAQAYPIFNLADLYPASGTYVTNINSFIPGTSIPITVSTSQPITRSGAGLHWQSSSSGGTTDLVNNWTITFGAPTEDVEITLFDFDRFFAPNAPLALETMSQLDATLGAPTSLVTTGAPGNAQMIYEAGVDGGRILHSTTFGPGNVLAGTAVALWEDVNLSSITFTTTRSRSTLGQDIDIRLGEVTAPPEVPEPASWALMLSAAGLAGFVRLRRKANAAAADKA